MYNEEWRLFVIGYLSDWGDLKSFFLKYNIVL